MNTKDISQTGESSSLNDIRPYFSALQNSTEDYLFVVNFETNKILISDNFITDFDFPSNTVDDIDELLVPFIHAEDREIYEEAMQAA